MRYLPPLARLLRIHPVRTALLRRHIPPGDDAVVAGKGDVAEGGKGRVALHFLHDRQQGPTLASVVSFEDAFLQTRGKPVLAVAEPDAQNSRRRILQLRPAFAGFGSEPDTFIGYHPAGRVIEEIEREACFLRWSIGPVGAAVNGRKDERAILAFAIGGEPAGDAAGRAGKGEVVQREVCVDMRARARAQPTCSPSVVSTSISPPVCWCGCRCCTLITPTTRLRAITGAERKASNVSSGSSPKNLNRGSRKASREIARRRRSRATQPVRPSLSFSRIRPISASWCVLDAHSTSSSLSHR